MILDVEKFLKLRNFRCGEILDADADQETQGGVAQATLLLLVFSCYLCQIYRKLNSHCHAMRLFCCKISFFLLFALFCRDTRTFVWRDIEPKFLSVEE